MFVKIGVKLIKLRPSDSNVGVFLVNISKIQINFFLISNAFFQLSLSVT